jgi:MFS transporter, FSR family, fosmidomycin resistance protein
MPAADIPVVAQPEQGARAGSRSRNLLAACLAHALHDGYTDGLYAFLPTWQAQFGLSYAGLAVVRALYYGTMGILQVPSDRLLRRTSPSASLVLSTLVAAAGLVITASPIGFAGLCVGLVIAGIGSSIQHPRASLLVSETYGDAARGPLGVYNFSGDLGKAALPALAALLLPIFSWRPVLGLMALLGLVTALGLVFLRPATAATRVGKTEKAPVRRGRVGFGLLTVIGSLDTATRMGYLLFLPS